MLVAFLLYNDGIGTIIRMASIYGTEIGIDRNAQIAAFVMVQFVGVPCAFLFGALADRIGAKRALFRLARRLHRHQRARLLHDHRLALLRAGVPGRLVQGGSQAFSRSLFARMIPRHKSSEFFGFFSVFEKFAGIAGPAIFAGSITLFGNSRAAVLSVILFFIAGAVVLTRVNVREGEAQAAAASLQAQ